MDSKAAVKREKNFWNVNSKLAEYGATYVSLLIFNQNNQLTYSLSSNPDWSDEFSSTGLYKKCHLLNTANELMSTNNTSFTLAWDLYLPETEAAKELDDIRKSIDISHGVGFCVHGVHQSKIMLNIAGKYMDVNFGLNILKNRKTVYNELYSIVLCEQLLCS